MTDKVLKLRAECDIGEDVSSKEAHFLKLLDPAIDAGEGLKPLTTSLMQRVEALRQKARRNLEHEQQEM